MKIIIGLGNPGEKYLGTRHNLGFIFLNKIQAAWNFSDFQFEEKFNAKISKGKFNDQDILLVKPQTFVNLSGQAVSRILHFYKIQPENILIVHDDLDLRLGTFRLSADSRSAGHNGVQSIIDQLDTQKFKRIRIGIGIMLNSLENLSPEALAKKEVFVLQKLSVAEKEQLEKIFPDVLKKIMEII